MLLMVKKGIRGGICHGIFQYVKASNNYMKNYDKNKESSYLKYWDVNNLYGWVEEISQFNKNFKKIYNEDSDVGYFLEVDVNYLEELHECHNDCHFYQRE